MALSFGLRATPLLFTLVGLTCARLAADEPSLEIRLKRLETEVGELRRENQTLRTELGLGSRSDHAAVAALGRENSLSVGGLVQVQAEFGDRGDVRFTSGHDRFYLRRARINAQGTFAENFEFRADVDLANNLAELNGNRGQLVDGYIGWTRFDFAHVRLGQVKSQFGFEEIGSDLRLPFVERSLASDRLTPGRQIGVQLTGDVADHRFTYATGFFNGTGANTSANDNDQFLWTARVAGTPWQGTLLGQPARWSVGANLFRTHDAALGSPAEFGFDSTPGGAFDNTFAGRRIGGGLDTQLHLGPLELWLEYLRTRFEPSNAIPLRRFDADGGYLLATLFLLPKQLQAVLRYDLYDPSLDVADNRTRTWSIGANWFIKDDDLKLQFDYLLIDLDGAAAREKKILLRLQSLF